MRNLLALVTRNPIGLLGAALTSVSAILFVSLFLFELVGFLGNPYIGIVAYLILPAIFLLGLLLIPIGIRWERKRLERAVLEGGEAPGFPVIDLNIPRTRRVVLTFLVLTVINLVILATATYKGVEVMETTEFCGTTCHTVMQPEHVAHARSPHSRVSCVDCHIGPGADWFVKSKLSGAWQVVSVAFDLYPRPIPTPVHDLRPARETCELCHMPSQFIGDRLDVRTHYSNDEANSETKSVLLLRVGGVQGGRSEGIHWHVDPANTIRYRSDPSRETIYEIELTSGDETVTFSPPDGTPEPEGPTVWRTMDCVDCHNRPTHRYREPAEEIDLALFEGRVDRELPFVRREGLRLMREEWASHDEAMQGIRDGMLAFYADNHPEVASSRRNVIEAAATELGRLHNANVFPTMNVRWGTYPDHSGHEASPGCFRCHNEEHVASDDGRTLSQDCDVCHSLLALEEEDPEILELLQP